jgi:hypothetical protein
MSNFTSPFMAKSPIMRKKKGCGHDSPVTFKGANSSNSDCWKGYRKVGTKPSPSGTGETVNDCVKIGSKKK